jgi:hypothetical protein
MEKYLNSMLVKNATEIVEQPIKLPPLTQRLANASKVWTDSLTERHIVIQRQTDCRQTDT